VLESSRVAGVLLFQECGLELGWRDIANGLQEPAVVEPVHPLQGGVLDLIKAPPGAALADQLSLVQPNDRLGQGIVIGVPAGTHRGDRAGLGQAFGVANGQVLAAPVRGCTSPSSWAWRRQMAISRASRARSVRSDREPCQPTR
jgi:hypothetical protein